MLLSSIPEGDVEGCAITVIAPFMRDLPFRAFSVHNKLGEAAGVRLFLHEAASSSQDRRRRQLHLPLDERSCSNLAARMCSPGVTPFWAVSENLKQTGGLLKCGRLE